jgi:cytochrome c oxidase subunit 2
MYGSKTTLRDGRTVTVDGAYITESIMDPLARIHIGFAPVMPSYLGRLTAPEVGAMVEYIRSLRVVPTDTELAPLPRERNLSVQPLLQRGGPETELPPAEAPPAKAPVAPAEEHVP